MFPLIDPPPSYSVLPDFAAEGVVFKKHRPVVGVEGSGGDSEKSGGGGVYGLSIPIFPLLFLLLLLLLLCHAYRLLCGFSHSGRDRFYWIVCDMGSSGIKHSSQPCVFGQSGTASGGKKSCFSRWLDKLFNRDLGRGRIENGRHPHLQRKQSMSGQAPGSAVGERTRAKNEECDRAVALSLDEGSKKPSGCRGETDSDEDLARALQDLENSPSYSPYRSCAGCKQLIGDGNHLSCMGTFWHPNCFCCYYCHLPITENEIPMNGAGLIEYRSHPFWCQRYCPSHEHDGTAHCCSCERLESKNARYISLGDRRSLCLECYESAIMDTGESLPLYHSIRDFYEGLNMKLEQQIPILLVERPTLNEAIEGEKNSRHHMPETRGLCLSEEQTITSIFRRPRFGGNRLVGMRTQRQKLTRRCDVTAILVLYGLPRLLTGSILAHELMHAWLRLTGFRNLNPMVEEGICQVLSHMWLESEIPISQSMPSTSRAPSSSSSSKKVGKSDLEKRLGEFFMHQIVHDTSTAYGEGYRTAYAAVTKHGLHKTLMHISQTGSLP
ncbi:hypothetical protein Sjap_013449 [Stephania japonica]|uniref:LIM zinc-binding domain-containing protein n=1 Tax=Stephania japonica TaxID=461633 RepID=A0AAP0NXN4_9MAGN